MTYYYTYSHNDNGRIRTVSKTFDSREAMEQFVKENNLPHPYTAFESLNDFFGMHSAFMNYLRDVFPSIEYQGRSSLPQSSSTSTTGRFAFDEYEQAVQALANRTEQKKSLEHDLERLYKYEKIFEENGHKEMLKKVRRDIDEAKKALEELSK